MEPGVASIVRCGRAWGGLLRGRHGEGQSLRRRRRFRRAGGDDPVRRHGRRARADLLPRMKARRDYMTPAWWWSAGRSTTSSRGSCAAAWVGSVVWGSRLMKKVRRRAALALFARNGERRCRCENGTTHYDPDHHATNDLFLDADRQLQLRVIRASRPEHSIGAQRAKKRHIAAKLLLLRPGKDVSTSVRLGWSRVLPRRASPAADGVGRQRCRTEQARDGARRGLSAKGSPAASTSPCRNTCQRGRAFRSVIRLGGDVSGYRRHGRITRSFFDTTAPLLRRDG